MAKRFLNFNRCRFVIKINVFYDEAGFKFFIERSYEEYAADKGRPTVPTKDLAKMNMKYKTYKATKKGAFGYMCERVK